MTTTTSILSYSPIPAEELADLLPYVDDSSRRRVHTNVDPELLAELELLPTLAARRRRIAA